MGGGGVGPRDAGRVDGRRVRAQQAAQRVGHGVGGVVDQIAAVVDAGDRAQGQGRGGDDAGAADRRRQAVVAGQEPARARHVADDDARGRHRGRRADVLGIVGPAGDPRQGPAVAADEIAEGEAAGGQAGGRGRPVIGLGLAGQRDRQGPRVDGAAARRRRRQGVVAQAGDDRAEVGRRQGRGQGGDPGVLGGGGRRGLGDRHVRAFARGPAQDLEVAGRQGVERHRPVIGLGRVVDDLGDQGRRVDRAGAGRRGRQLVVRQVGDGVVEVRRRQRRGDRGGPAVGGGVLGIVVGAGLLDHRHVGALARGPAGQQVVGGGQRRQGRAVVGLGRVVDDARRDHRLGDVGRQARGLDQAVVVRLGAGQAEARGRDLDIAGRIGVLERRGVAAGVQADAVGAQGGQNPGQARGGHRGRRGPVVGLVVGRDRGDGQGQPVDVGRQGRLDQGVVVQIGRARQAVGRGRGHRQVRTDIDAAEDAGRRLHQGHVLARDHAVQGPGVDRGRIGLVVGLAVGAGVQHRQDRRVDGPGAGHADDAAVRRGAIEGVVGQAGGAGGGEVRGRQDRRDGPRAGVGRIVGRRRHLADGHGVRADESGEAEIAVAQGGVGRGVIGLGRIADDAHRHRRARDRALAIGHGRQDVVGEQGPAGGRIAGGVRLQGHRDRIDPGVGAAQGSGRGIDRDAVAVLQALQIEVRRRQEDAGQAVVDLGRVADDADIQVVGARAAQRERRGVDQARPRHDGGQAVVGQGEAVGAEHVAADIGGDRPGAGVGRGVGPRRLAHGGRLAADQAAELVVRAGQGRRIGPVVGLGRVVDDIDLQRGLVDQTLRRVRRGGRQGVVGQAGSRTGGEVALGQADGDGLGRRAGVGAGVGGRGGLADGHAFARDQARKGEIGRIDRRDIGAVVGLVDRARQRHRQRRLGDVGGQPRGLKQAVVGAVRPRDGQPRHRNGDPGADVLAGEGARRGAAEGEDVAADHPVQPRRPGQGGRGGPVVGPADGGQAADGQGRRGDAGGQAGGLNHRVVRGQGRPVRQGDPRDRHGQVAADIGPGGERRAGPGGDQADVRGVDIAAEGDVAQVQGGGAGAVIDLVQGHHAADGQGRRGDDHVGRRQGGRQDVIAQADARTGDVAGRTQGHAEGAGRGGVGRVVAGRGRLADGDGLARDQAADAEIAAGEVGRGRAVIGLAERPDQVDRRRRRGDRTDHALVELGPRGVAVHRRRTVGDGDAAGQGHGQARAGVGLRIGPRAGDRGDAVAADQAGSRDVGGGDAAGGDGGGPIIGLGDVVQRRIREAVAQDLDGAVDQAVAGGRTVDGAVVGHAVLIEVRRQAPGRVERGVGGIDPPVAARTGGLDRAGAGVVDEIAGGVEQHSIGVGGRAGHGGVQGQIAAARGQAHGPGGHGIADGHTAGGGRGREGAAGQGHRRRGRQGAARAQGQAAGSAVGDGGVDRQAVVGGQGQGVGRGPVDRRGHRQIAGSGRLDAGARGHARGADRARGGLQGDVGGGQGRLDRRGGRGVDGQVGGIQQPMAAGGVDLGRAERQGMAGGLHLAAAARAAGPDHRAVGDGRGVRQAGLGRGDAHQHLTALGPARVQRPRDQGAFGPGDHDLAARAVGVAGRHGARGLDGAVGRAQPYLAADGGGSRGLDQALPVAGQGVDVAARRRQGRGGGADLAVLGHVAGRRDVRRHIDFVGGDQAGRAVGRLDRAAVAHRAADHHHIALLGDHRTQVGDVAEAVARSGHAGPGHELAVGNVAGGQDGRAARHHLAVGSDHHALRVDQIQGAGGGEPAVDLRRLAAGDPVQRRARAVVDRHCAAGADGEILPVDDAARAELIDRQAGQAIESDRPGARGELAALRQHGGGLDRHGRAQADEGRRRRAQQGPQAGGLGGPALPIADHADQTRTHATISRTPTTPGASALAYPDF